MLKSLELGQSVVITADPALSKQAFVDLVKQYTGLIKQSQDALVEFDRLKKQRPKENARQLEEGETELDRILTRQQNAQTQAKQLLDKAYKIYKKDKALKKIVDISSKRDLEDLVRDALFMDRFK